MTTLLDANKRSGQWQALLSQEDYPTLLDLLQEAPIIEVAEFLQQQDLSICARILELFDIQTQAALFSNLAEGHQLELYKQLTPKKSATIFAHMASDLRADFYQKLTEQQQTQLLPYLPKKITKDVITLTGYSQEVAGGIMTTDFATVYDDMTVQQALDKVREDAPSKKMLYYLYVVDKDMKLLGFLDLKELLMLSSDTSIKEALQDTFVFANVLEDRELVAQKIGKYNLVALPVLNDSDQLVGVVTYDDAIGVLNAENTEDMEKFMGILSDHEETEPYLQLPSFTHFRRRVGWVVGLFIASFFSGYIMHKNEAWIQQITLLAMYMTTINDLGGNIASQVAMVLIRAMTLRQIFLKDFFKIILKEVKVALLFVLCFFALAFLKVAVLSGNLQPDKLSLVVGIAVGLQAFTATIIGAILPLFVQWMGKDPALAASPAITTLVDITGTLIYFSTAKFIFS